MHTQNQSINRIVRLPQILAMTGMSKPSVYAWIKENKFPRPIKIGSRSVGWVESEISAWIQERIAARDEQIGGGKMNFPNKKMTVRDYQSWCEAKATKLEAAETQRQQAVNNVVIRDVMGLREKEMTLDEAGDHLVRCNIFRGTRNGVFVSIETQKHSLRKMGWKPLVERKKGR